MVAAKNSDYGYYDYDYYKRVGGMSEKDSRERLESDMKNVLEGDLSFAEEDIKAYDLQHGGQQGLE